MLYLSCYKLCTSEFHNIVSAENRKQDINLNRLKLLVNDIFKKVEKTTTNFEPSNDEDVIDKAYVDKTLSEKTGSFFMNRKRL